jgi:hypothetical protein
MDRGQREPYLMRGLSAIDTSELVEIAEPSEMKRALEDKGLISE